MRIRRQNTGGRGTWTYTEAPSNGGESVKNCGRCGKMCRGDKEEKVQSYTCKVCTRPHTDALHNQWRRDSENLWLVHGAAIVSCAGRKKRLGGPHGLRMRSCRDCGTGRCQHGRIRTGRAGERTAARPRASCAVVCGVRHGPLRTEVQHLPSPLHFIS